MSNERRNDDEVIKKLEEIRKECEDGHKENNANLAETNKQMAVVVEKISQIEETQRENSLGFREHDRKIAVQEAKQADLEKDKDTIYGMIGEDREKGRGGAGSVISNPDNAKWYVGGAIVIVLLFAMTIGAITTKDATDIIEATK